MPQTYSVDAYNRLVIRRKKEELTAQGLFSTDKDNRLIYWLNEPSAWQAKYQLPKKIVFTGRWKLNPDYGLELEVRQNRLSLNRETLALKGEIIACEKDSLVFEIHSLKKNGLDSFNLLKLSGKWQADEFNRLTFLVTRKDFPDTLTFQGAWQLNDNQQIAYTYERTNLRTKTRSFQSLTFSGYWEITSARRISYILSRGANSRFDFKAQIESPSLYPKDGVIKYRLGIGVKEPKKEDTRIISLYGAWKFSRQAGLIFEIDHKEGRTSKLEFGADVRFPGNNQIAFNLTAKNGERLGATLSFTHKFLKDLDASLFLRLKKLAGESRIDGGIKIPF